MTEDGIRRLTGRTASVLPGLRYSPKPQHVRMVWSHARFMDVRPDTGPSGGATVRFSPVEVRALLNIVGLWPPEGH
jgi:hypothetical protein